MPSQLKSSLRRLRTRFRRRDVDVVYATASTVPIGGSLFDIFRAERILDFLVSEGLLRMQAVHSADAASFRQLGTIHTDEYLQSLQAPSALTPIVGFEPSELQTERIVAAARRAVGGTIGATALALRRRSIAVHLGGGFHHAHPDHGGGFCVFNDAAVALAEAREVGFGGRTLIVDLDLHDGDGNRAIFAGDPLVRTLSLHNRSWGPDAENSVSVDLGAEVDDTTYLEAVRHHVPAILEPFEPDLVIYLAGTDPAHDDALGDWDISPAGMLARDLFVTDTVRTERIPLVILLAGGYGRNTWRYSARFFSALLNGGVALEPPSTDNSTLRHYRDLARRLDPAQLTSGPASETDWGLSEEDLTADLGGHARRTRFLDFYTPQGVELALENAGFLERLRHLGFEHPTVVVDLDNPTGQTVRIFGDGQRTQLVAELRASRDKSSLKNAELLRIEWLLLQDPRRGFPDDRPPLPGQEHPGLGLLQDVMALLVVVCDRLGLDGVLMVPAHFHIAAIARKHMTFLHADHGRRFGAIARALVSVPLEEATRALDRGRVVDLASGEPVRWEPAPMVLPTSEALRERVRRAHREREDAPAADRPRYQLVADPG